MPRVRIVRKGFGKELDRDTAAQLRVGGLIHLSHAACSQVAGDFVMCEFGSDHEVTKRPGGFYQNRKSLRYLNEQRQAHPDLDLPEPLTLAWLRNQTRNGQRREEKIKGMSGEPAKALSS